MQYRHYLMVGELQGSDPDNQKAPGKNVEDAARVFLVPHQKSGEIFPYRTPNHATYEMDIITIKRRMRILYPQLWQMPKWDGFCSCE